MIKEAKVKDIPSVYSSDLAKLVKYQDNNLEKC